MLFRNLGDFYGYIKPYRWVVCFGLLLLLISGRLEMYFPELMGRSVDVLTSVDGGGVDGKFKQILKYVIWMVGLMILKGFFLYYARYYIVSVSRKVERDIREKLFQHIIELDLGFFGRRKTGDLLLRLTSDIEYLRMIFGPGILYLFSVLFLMIFAIWGMVQVDMVLSLYVIVPFLSMLYLIRKIGHRYYGISKRVQAELSRMTDFVNEKLQGIQLIKGYVKEGYVESAFRGLNGIFLRENLRLASVGGLFRLVLYFMVGVVIVLLLWIGGGLVMRGELGLGRLVEFLRYVEILSIPLMGLGWIMSFYQRGLAGYSRVKALFEEGGREVEANDGGGVVRGDFMIKEIEVCGVSFGYEGKKVLEGLNLKIRSGEKVGLIGGLGSGKSSLTKLLMRLYEVWEGDILIDGVSIRGISRKALRSRIGYVSQEGFVFPETILNNMRLGVVGGGMEGFGLREAKEVARIVEFDGDVEGFKNGYEEVVGERGVTLSGGQKQRLSLARALSSDRDIYIFDDCFSNLDAKTERLILRNLYREYRDKTMIIVGNRSSTLEWVDRVVILEGGRVHMEGCVEELLEGDNYYRDLVEKEELLKGMDLRWG